LDTFDHTHHTFENVRQYVFHNDKRPAETKEEVFVPPPEQLQETKVVINAYHPYENLKLNGLNKSLVRK